MKPLLYLSLLAFAACGVKHTSVDYGKTSSADLIAEKGEPIAKTDVPVKNTEIFEYKSNEKYQVKDDVVTHGFKDPKGNEKTLLYWKHKFKDCDTTTRKISEKSGHELPEYELKCSSEGLTVIYTEGSDFVSRVIEHAKN
jgi:hypothetical protein